MEEEVDDPILAKLNGTQPPATPPPAVDDDPILKQLNSGIPLKKKDESASNSPDGSGSAEPVKPSEKSTKKQSLSESQERLKKLYEYEYTDWRDKRSKAINDEYGSWVNTRLAEIQKQVDKDPSQVNVLNDQFKDEQKKKAKEMDSIFADEQKKKFATMDKDLNKFLDIQRKRDAKQNPRSVYEKEGRTPDILESTVSTIYSGLADQIPKEYYVQRLRMSKGNFGDLFDPRHDLNQFSDQLPEEINRDEFNQWNNKLNSEERGKSYDDKAKKFIIEKLGRPAYDKLKAEFLVKNEDDRVGFEKAIQEQNKQAAFHTQGVVQDLRDVKGATDFLSFAGNMIGQSLYRAPVAIATGTTGSIIAESAAVYDEQLDLIAQKEGITREEVIKKGLDKPAEGQALSVALGVMDAVSAGTLLGVFKQAAKKELKRQVVKEFVKGFAKGAATEGATEAIQTEGEQYAAAKGAGVDYSPDAWRIATSAVGGAIGGGVLSGTTSTNSDFQNEPAMQVDQVSLEQKIQELVNNVDGNDQVNVEAVANAVESTVNKPVTDEKNQTTEQPGATDNSLILPENTKEKAAPIQEPANEKQKEEYEVIPRDSKGLVQGSEFNYAPNKNLSEGEKEVETKFGKDLNDNYEERKQQYKSKFGNVFDADLAKELSEDYNNDPKGVANSVHNPGSSFVQKMYTDSLKEPAPEGKENKVTFVIGGAASGKTTYVENSGVKDTSQIVYTSFFGDLQLSKNQINRALNAGKDVDIKFISRDQEEAYNSMLERSKGNRREVPLDIFNKSYSQSNETLEKLKKEYDGNERVNIEIVDNGQNGSKQGQEGPPSPPPKKPSEGTEMPSEKQRKFSIQLLNDLDLNSKVKKGLSEDAISYVPKGIKISNAEARAIVETKGGAAAMTDFLDMTNGMLPDVRVMLGENLIRKFNAEENYDSAIKVADNLAMQLTDLGRGVNAAKSFSLLTPEGVIRYVQKEITKSKDKSSRDTAPKRKKSKEAVDKENAKAVKKILDPESKTGQAIIEQAEKAKAQEAIDFLEKLKLDNSSKGMATAQIVPLGLPIAAWNLAITTIQQAIKAGLTIKQAITRALNKIKAAGHTIDEKQFREYFNDKLKDYTLAEDRKTRYTPPITQSEREDAIAKISEELVPKSGTTTAPKLKPAIQEFYDRLVTRMVGSQPKMKGKSAYEVLKEVLQNIDKYADVLQGVRDELSQRGVDVSDVQSIFDLPYFKKQLNKSIADDIRAVIGEHYSVVSNTKLTLAEKLTNVAGISQEGAIDIQKEIVKAIDQITSDEKKKALKKYLPKAKKGQEKERQTLVDQIVEASNLGAMDEDVYRDAISEKLGPQPMTAADGVIIKKLADRIQTAKSEFDRNKAQEDLIRYIDKNVKGIRWTDVGMSIWYANVLSGLSTQLQNLYGNLTNTISEAYVTMALSPKESGWIFKGLFNGYGRGLLEAMDTVKSGYQPIKGDVKQVTASPVLETTTFKGGAWNPYNYLKYVTRLMAATDIFFYHGLKEMRSRELAVAAAKKENKVNPGQSAIAQAKKQLYGEETAWKDAQEQAELEGYTGKEKTRRAYELLEKARPEYILEDSNDAALRGTYNNQPEGALGMLSGVINMAGEKLNIGGIKPIKFIVPFTRIIANVANTALDYSPWAFGRYAKGAIGYEGFGDNYYHKYTQEEKSKLLVKGITGTLAMAALAALTDDEDGILEITADGTGDMQKNFELQETGWQPYSIKIGGTWYEYRNTPLAIPFAMVGYWRDGQKYKGKADDDLMTRVSILTYGTLKYIMDLSFLQSLSGFFDSFSKEKTASGKNYFEKATKGTEKVIKSFIVPNAFTQASKSMQEIMDLPQKEANQLGDQIIRDMPVLRDRLDNMYNSLGDPVIPNQVSKFLPFKMRSEPSGKDKELYDIIANNNAWIGKPGRTALKINSGESMTDEEYEQFCFAAGKATKASLLENIAELRSMKDGEEIKDLIRKLKVQARREANIQLFGEKSYF